MIYESEVVLTGRLGNYGLGLMKKRAQALGQEFARNLQRLLTGSQSDGMGVLH